MPHRTRLAFLLALLAALCWGLLPLALHIVVPVLDTCTITWCRFLFAGIVFGAMRIQDEQQTSTPFSSASAPRYFPHS